MDNRFYIICVYGLFIFGVAAVGISASLLPDRKYAIPKGYIKDPCIKHHNQKTVSDRDFKPQYNRSRANKVVLTCGDK